MSARRLRMGRFYYQRETANGCVEAHSPEMIFTQKAEYYTDIVFHYRNDKSDFYVVTAGHEKNWPDKVIRDRVTDRLMIFYVVDGQGYLNDQPVRKGQGFFLYPNQKHTILQDCHQPMEFYYLTFRGSKMADYLLNIGFHNIPQIFDFDWQDKIIPIFEDMIYRSHAGADMEMYLFGASQMILSYQKYYYNKNKSSFVVNSAAQYVKEAVKYIRQNFTEDITVETIAKRLHTSPNYLCNIFRKELGYSPLSLIISLRMEHAANLLVENKFTVKQIAWMVGYKDYSQFSKMFKKHHGITPAEYAKKVLNG